MSFHHITYSSLFPPPFGPLFNRRRSKATRRCQKRQIKVKAFAPIVNYQFKFSFTSVRHLSHHHLLSSVGRLQPSKGKRKIRNEGGKLIFHSLRTGEITNFFAFSLVRCRIKITVVSFLLILSFAYQLFHKCLMQ